MNDRTPQVASELEPISLNLLSHLTPETFGMLVAFLDTARSRVVSITTDNPYMPLEDCYQLQWLGDNDTVNPDFICESFLKGEECDDGDSQKGAIKNMPISPSSKRRYRGARSSEHKRNWPFQK